MQSSLASETTQPAPISYAAPYAIWNALRHERMSGIPTDSRRVFLRMALRIAADNLDRLGLHEDARRARAMAGSLASVSLGYRCLRASVEKIEHELQFHARREARGSLAAVGARP